MAAKDNEVPEESKAAADTQGHIDSDQLVEDLVEDADAKNDSSEKAAKPGEELENEEKKEPMEETQKGPMEATQPLEVNFVKQRPSLEI